MVTANFAKMGCGASTPNGQGATPVLKAKQGQHIKPADLSSENGTEAVQQAAKPEAPEKEQSVQQEPSQGPRQDPACQGDVRRVAPTATGALIAYWYPAGTCLPVPADVPYNVYCRS